MTIEHPVRVDHRYTQHLEGSPEEIFPLLCPVREAEWVRGWDPPMVITRSGYAEFGCVFTTQDDFGTSTWFVSDYNRERHHIEFVKFTPGRFVVFIEIDLQPDGPNRSLAECRYQYTAISAAGRDFVEGYTENAYNEFMRAWESELNHFLTTGHMLGT